MRELKTIVNKKVTWGNLKYFGITLFVAAKLKYTHTQGGSNNYIILEINITNFVFVAFHKINETATYF